MPDAIADPPPDSRSDLGELPEWNLDDLYSGPDCAELRRDLETAGRAAEVFNQRYQGKVADLSGDELGEAVAEFDAQQDRLGRISSYAQLLHAGHVNDPSVGRFYQDTNERVTDITAELIFFTLEIIRIGDGAMEKLLPAPKLARYAPWIRDTRSFRGHELSDDLERVFHDKQVTGSSSWIRLFDETMASLRFTVRGQELTSEEALHMMTDKDRSVRADAAKALSDVFEENQRLLGLITNTLAKDKEIEDRWRNFDAPASSRHLANFIEPEVVDALLTAVTSAYPRLSHRYYAMKARWLGLDHLEYWDRNAPLPDDSDRVRPWAEARDTVLDAYRRFSPDLADLGRRFFDSPWIDAPVREGKAAGAFAHPTVPSAHPYLLLNYQGRTRDVMTLAHELGHGVHQLLAAPQGALMSDTPLTLAETASVFGEQLTFRSLLESESDPRRRQIMLAGKVEDMLNTVVRQIAFYQFELRVHDERGGGELTAERLCEIWLDVQRESLGPAVHLDPAYRTWWCYIPHFIHAPFYVYAYAFGDCLVNSLYAVYQEAEQGFQEKYFDMLRAGGTRRHKELLAPFGLDASDPDFWSKGLAVIETFIDELEAAPAPEL
ncbi:MAG: M3 family oligoendopeptidase [Proteobacteria bacterium]|nr:M3 family oligoendopeptidase [Pseudomonadota bacterium]